MRERVKAGRGEEETGGGKAEGKIIEREREYPQEEEEGPPAVVVTSHETRFSS